MRYFPLSSDRFEHEFGIRALPAGDCILEQTARYREEITLKRQLLAGDLHNYYAALPDSEPAAAEAAEQVAAIARTRFSNVSPVSDKTANDPLLLVSTLVQEDLVVLSGDPELDFPIIAGVVCFPSGWSIADKLGASIAATHAPVPEFETVLADATRRLLAKLKADRPVWRTNWGIRCSNQLDQSPKHAERLREQLESLTTENVGARCCFRVERQTLSRLPETSAILFTIHTHQCPLNRLTTSERRQLLGVVRTCPDATLAYKGIAAMRDRIEVYLSSSIQEAANPASDWRDNRELDGTR